VIDKQSKIVGSWSRTI